MKLHPDVNISISGGGSSHGIKSIIDGTTDIAATGNELALAVQLSELNA